MLLEKIWKNKKNELEYYLRDYSSSLQSITNSFGRVGFTIDPTEEGEYDPRIDTMIFNLWALLFSPIERQYCIPSHPLNICEILIHEFDHYCFLKEHDMIGRTDQEFYRFNNDRFNEAEKRALLSQCNFLEKSKEKARSHESYRISVIDWTKKGEPLFSSLKRFEISREETVQMIYGNIDDYKNVLRQIDIGKEYDEMATASSIKSYSKLVTILSLPIKLEPVEHQYPIIEIKM